MSRLPSLPPEPESSAARGDTLRTSTQSAESSDSSIPNLVNMVMGFTERAGQRIGPYRIIKRLGGGGYGDVWLAERTEPFFQRVAIKLIRAGYESGDMVARFEQERQTLAALKHPNIARVLDAGKLEPDGQPYLVMEFVDGRPIDQYCDSLELNIVERLRLFQKVCSAVHYAHQNLIVHRDIKPANILVGGDGEPKLLDFGIAKLLNPELAAATPQTVHQAGPMTPEYASPEQLQGLQLNTASDVYTLGVLLYELLTGRRPYRLASRSREAIARVILEEEPERPSDAVTKDVVEQAGDGTTHTRTAQDLARPRDSQPGKLKRALAGDIDNIVLMAMRKNPRRRYTSAEQLADDIGRHLGGKTVIARPETWVYVAGKFVRRNRVPVAAAAVAIAALLTGVVVSTAAMREAQAKHRIAERQRDDVRATVKMFLKDFLVKAGAEQASSESRAMLARTALDMLKRLEEGLGVGREELGDPRDRELTVLTARALEAAGDALGGTGAALGDTAEALASYTRALKVYESLASGKPDGELGRWIANLKVSLARVSRKTSSDLDAMALLNDAVSAAEAPAASPEEEPAARRVLAAALVERGRLNDRKGQHDAAKADFDRAIEVWRSVKSRASGGPDDERNYTVAQLAMARHLADSGRAAEAKRQYKDAIDARRAVHAAAAAANRSDQATVRALRDVMTALGEYVRSFMESDDPDVDRAVAEQVRIADQLAADFDSRSVLDRARAIRFDGMRMAHAGKLEPAIARLAEAAASAEKLQVRQGRNTEFLLVLADTQFQLGEAQSRAGRADQARASWESARRGYDLLAGESPEPYYKTQLELLERRLSGAGGGS